jgi:PAS domain S-box-containing protein
VCYIYGLRHDVRETHGRGAPMLNSGGPLRVVLVDDDPGEAARIVRDLESELRPVDVQQIADGGTLDSVLEAGLFDAVVTESRLGWTDGLAVLRAVKDRHATCPVIMVTASETDELAVAGIWSGLDEVVVLTPRQPRRLATAVRSAVESMQERATQQWIDDALRQSEPGARALLDAVPEGIVTIDERGCIETINLAGARLFGYPADDLIGKGVGVLMLPPRISSDRAADLGAGPRYAIASGVGISREVEGLRRDGSTFPLSLSVREVQHGGRRLFVSIVRDVTERYRAEEERQRLIASERAALAAWRREATEKSLMLEQMLEAVIVTDRDGRWTLANEAAGRLLGMDPKQLVGIGLDEQPWLTFDETGEPIAYERRPLVRALRGERANMVQRLKTADGRDVIIRAASTPVRDDRGEIIGAVHVVHDLTEDYARARQAAQGAKLRSLGELASGVAHDLNQYLGLVAGYGDLALEALSRATPGVEAAREALDTMVSAAVDGAEVVRRLLLFARPTLAGPAERVDLSDVMRDVLKLTQPKWRDASQLQGRRIVAELLIDGDVSIDGWPAALREAFANLVLNAVDALPSGGTLRLAAAHRDGSVIAEVIDDGIGMASEIRDRLFEPFFSTKGESGSGLGLSIVSGIVERHGGTIVVESEPGQGTTFRLTFPVATGAELFAPTLPPQASVSSRRILVVDDEPALGSMLARLLETDAHVVRIATSGAGALEILMTFNAEVIVSDLGLGPGINGWELAATVRGRQPRPYFILATGWGAELDADDAVTRGVDAIVAKPYRLPDFRRVLADL